jgi:hypothetical protein
MTKILKVNDVNFGDLFKACGRHVVGRPLLFRDIAESEYSQATITGFDSTTQRHQLQLHPNQTKLPPPTAATGSPISVDLSKADVRSVPSRATDVPTPSSIETPPPPTLALRTPRAAAARAVAQTSVHTDIAHTDNAHTDNITTAVARFTPTPTKGKRFFISTNDPLSSATAKRKTQKVSRKALASDKKENPTNDAHLLAFEDPVPATITSPFSADSPRALALDHELSADLPGFLSNPFAKVVSSCSFRLLFFFPTTTSTMTFFSSVFSSTITATVFSPPSSRWWSLLPNGTYVLLVLLTINHPRPRSMTT